MSSSAKTLPSHFQQFQVFRFIPPVQSIPDGLKCNMPTIRMIQLMKEPEQSKEYATDVEAMIYIMTASLVFPLSHHWTPIYMHLARKYLLDWKEKKPEELSDFLKDEIDLDD